MPTLDQLQATAATAEARAAKARDAAAGEQHRHNQARQVRLAAHDRQLVADYDDDAAEREVGEARRALEQAILADPVVQAAVAARAAMSTRSLKYGQVSGAATRLGDDAWSITHGPPSPGHLDLRELVGLTIERAASQRAAEVAEAAAAERDRAGDSP